MHIAILGRQPALGIAELECVFGDTRWFSPHTALVATDALAIEHLGGTLKAGRVVAELPRGDWRQASMQLVKAYGTAWAHADHKITLGISAYGFQASARDVQKTGLILKDKLKKHEVSVRLIPNNDPALNTATSHHNKLGLSPTKVELIVVRGSTGKIIIAESTGAQNITALARRDQNRPKRDTFVGMLPPKLAQIMINLARPPQGATLLDPFCGTGVLLQEALLLGYNVYGTDLSDKMVDYSTINLDWLKTISHAPGTTSLHQADAMTATWHQPINAVATETYLGQPFSAPPSAAKLTEVRGNCNHIIGRFLDNITNQLASGTPLCVAVPAWRAGDDTVTHLPLTRNLEQFGLERLPLTSVSPEQLLYYREDQIVARELLVLRKK